MTFEVPGVPAAYDRGPSRPNTSDVIFRGGNQFYAQAEDHNEAHTIARLRAQRISDRILKDGDRIEGADAIVDIDAQTVHCLAGKIYIGGDIHPVPDATLADVPMAGEVMVGVRVLRAIVTEIEDPTLYGLQPGTAGEGEPGAARRQITLSWGFGGDGEEGELYSVYRLASGTIVNQAPPPAATGVQEQIARYDRDSNGNYIVDGCDVTPLGKIGGSQGFSIAAGTANIFGYKRIRETAFRYLELETPDLELIAGEVHIFTGATGGVTTIGVNRAPLADVQLVIVAKRVTENRVRGAVAGGFDDLTYASAYRIESVTQGATTFDPAAYSLVNGQVSWGNPGAEPAASSTYAVTYLYNAVVEPTALSDRGFTVAGGVNNEPVTVTYHSKVPRIDALCLDIQGRPVYRKGISARIGALPPQIPDDLLKLAEIYNDWMNVPVVANNGTPNFAYDELVRYVRLLINVVDAFSRSQAENNLQASSLVARGKIFTDTFIDDYYRDQGAAQTAAINSGVLQLAVDNVLMMPVVSTAATLQYTDEVVVAQPQRTSSVKINPYDNFVPMPAGMTLAPPADFWTDQITVWTSGVTQEFAAAPDRPPGTTSYDEVARLDRSAAEFLRQIAVDVLLEGFGVGEDLASLTLDDVNVKPAGTQTANGSGQISLTIAIPAHIPSGRRLVRADGAAGSFAEAIYVGEGVIDTQTMRRVTLVTRAAPATVVINNTVIQQTIVTLNQLVNPVVTGDRGVFADHTSIDPLAQSFRVPSPRMVTGVNFWLAAIGNRAHGIRVQLATMENGFPTTDIMAEAFIAMATPVVGQKLEARFDLPVFLSPLREYCIVILTSDDTHAVAISRLGDVYSVGSEQQRVSSQPYTIGEMFTSSNRITWTTHPEADLAFEIVGAKFTGTTRTVTLWSGPLDTISDLMVRGAIELPSQDTAFHYELVRANGDIIRLLPGQSHAFAEFVSETVTLRAVLEGTGDVSPVLYPNTLIAGGRLRTSGTYVTRATPMGAGVDAYALFAAKLPGSANVAVAIDKADDTFVPMTLDTTGVLGDGWTEPKFKKAGFNAQSGRIRLTLTGSPAERPLVSGALRVYPI